MYYIVALGGVKILIPSQMLKGILEGSILKVINQKQTYGYEISQELQKYGFSNISEGTIYPLLLRLERNGLIEAQYKESSLGPKRKYFSLSQAGKNEMSAFFSNWLELKTAVDWLFQNEGGNNEQKN